MDDLSSRLTYMFSILGAFFTGLSLYEISFLFCLVVSVSLGVMNFLLNRREQKARTRIFERYLEKVSQQLDPTLNIKNARSINELMKQAKKDL